MEHSKKFDEFILQNEGRWNDIFGKLGLGGPKKQGIAKALGKGEYAIGNNKVFDLAGVNEDDFLNYDWINGKLSFLAKGSWVAKQLHLKVSNGLEQVISFMGEWTSGDFVGGGFIGKFHGGRFNGRFASHYSNYLADPSTFVGGVVTSFTEGVLGMTKLDVTSLNASSQKKVVSLLELQPNYYCNLTDDHGTTHSFCVTKSCDNTSMDIELQEETGQKRAIRIPWSEIRKSDDPNMFRRLSSIRIGMKLHIPYLFANDRVGTIKDIEVSTKGTMFGTTVDTYKLDTSLLRPIVLPVHIQEMTIHLFTPEEVVKYGKIYQDLVNNGMQLHMRNILDGVKFGIIKGWDGFPHLATIFGNQQGSSLNHPKYTASMKWLDEFVQTVVLRMVKSRMVGGTYVPSEGRRKMVMDQLASMVRSVQAAPPVAPAAPVAPAGAPAPSPATGKSRTMVP